MQHPKKHYVHKKLKRKRGRIRCWYCGNQAHNFDHQIPQSKLEPGEFVPNNKVPSCFECNTIKADRTVEEFRAAIRQWARDMQEVPLGPVVKIKCQNLVHKLALHKFIFYAERNSEVGKTCDTMPTAASREGVDETSSGDSGAGRDQSAGGSAA